MSNISYIITPATKLEIEKIEKLRTWLLALLIPRRVEQEARFEINVDRASFASRLTDNKLKKSEVFNIVNPFEKNRVSDIETQGYFRGYLWIDKKWFLNREEVKPSDIHKILTLCGVNKKIDEEKLKQAIDFVQVSPEHPVAQSALFFYLIFGLIDGKERIKLSSITSNIFMYKAGFDFRGFLCLEEFLVNDLDHLKKLLEEDLTGFIQYFAQGVAIQAEKALLKMKNYEAPKSNLFALSDRDNEILSLFDKPGVKITNRRVQKEFKISQITSSRDLSRLAAMGLIFKNGRGRSVYYTKF